MKTKLLIVGLAVGLIASLVWPLVVQARAQLSAGQIASLRWRLIGFEPIAAPDGRQTVNGWSVAVFRETRTDQCFTAFMSGTAMAVTGPAVCP